MHSRVQAVGHASAEGHVDVVDGSEAVFVAQRVVGSMEDLPCILSPYWITSYTVGIEKTFNGFWTRRKPFEAIRDEVAVCRGKLALSGINVVEWVVCQIICIIPAIETGSVAYSKQGLHFAPLTMRR